MKFDLQDVELATSAVNGSAVSLNTVRYVNQDTWEVVDEATRESTYQATERAVDDVVVNALEPGAEWFE